MNKEVAVQWVEALRSGKFKQGRSRLQDSEGNYCCLGVLCEIAPPEVPKERDPSGRLRGTLLDAQRPVMDWASLNGDGGDFSKSLSIPKDCACGDPKCVQSLSSLVALNDNAKMTFEQIADFIEKNSEAL